MKPKTEYVLTTAIVIGGALLTWFAYSRTWQQEPPCATSFVPRCGQPTSGADLEPAGAALALITALTSLAVIPTRGRGRRIVGMLLLLLGLTGVAVALAATSLSPSSWWVVAAIGSTVTVMGSIVTIRRAPNWPTMSSRYERSDARPDAGPGATGVVLSGSTVEVGVRELAVTEAWDALDRGLDPTLGSTSDSERAETPDSEPRPYPGGLAGTGLPE